MRAELAADFIVKDYFYVNSVNFQLLSNIWYCFPEFVVNVDEVVEIKANLDGYWGYNPSIHYDMKIDKDGAQVAAASSVEDDTTDILGLMY